MIGFFIGLVLGIAFGFTICALIVISKGND